MHKILIFCAFVFLCKKTNAQYNLVPNPSFEDYTACPSGGGQLPLAFPWTGPTIDDSDYLNSCATHPTFSVPTQSFNSIIYNYQVAKTGVGYIDMYVYNWAGANYREYAQIQLLDTLQIGQCYYVEFFVNRANSAYGGKYATNNLGCLFNDTALTTTGNGDALDIPANILKFGNPIITDTLNWVEVSGIYTSNGNERFIVLGNFANDFNTDTLDMMDGTYPGAIYFFDDVSVIPIDSIPGGMPAYAGVDTNVILGDSVFIGQKISNLNCNWYDSNGVLIASNISGIYVSPTTSTYYVVEQNLCGNITYDTVNVTVLPTSVSELFNENEVRIYPNPNNGTFTITHNLKDKNYALEIVDLMGKVIHREFLILGNQQEIKTQLLNTGIYFVNIKSEVGELMYSSKMSVIH